MFKLQAKKVDSVSQKKKNKIKNLEGKIKKQ